MTVRTAVVILCLIVGPVLGGVFADDGIPNPPKFYQRYRLESYPSDRPFYQWWYFSIRNFESGHSFALSYGMSKCVKNKTREGAYMMFSGFEREEKDAKTWEVYEKFDLDELHVSDEYTLDVVPKDGTPSPYFLHVLDDDTYHLSGKMYSMDRRWYVEGVAKDIKISWDFEVSRLSGWYGQQDLELLAEIDKGLIDWNTYAFNSLAKGTITVDDKVYELDHSKNWRVYGDMNWGDIFPSGPSRDYSWGWYSAVVPKEDPSQDIAIIAGTGKEEMGFPFYSMTGSFCDITYDNGRHVGFRHVTAWNTENADIELLATASDGDFVCFNVTRSQWTDYEDDLGNATIPLVQTVDIASTTIHIRMKFESTVPIYSRLLFPHEDYIFSDFEALLVPVSVTVTNITTGEKILDQVVNNGGVEFGYKVPIKSGNL